MDSGMTVGMTRHNRQPYREHFVELSFGAPAPAGQDHHLQVKEFAQSKIVAGLNHVVHHEQPAAGIHALSAGFQYLGTLLIGPIMQVTPLSS